MKKILMILWMFFVACTGYAQLTIQNFARPVTFSNSVDMMSTDNFISQVNIKTAFVERIIVTGAVQSKIDKVILTDPQFRGVIMSSNSILFSSGSQIIGTNVIGGTSIVSGAISTDKIADGTISNIDLSVGYLRSTNTSTTIAFNVAYASSTKTRMLCISIQKPTPVDLTKAYGLKLKVRPYGSSSFDYTTYTDVAFIQLGASVGGDTVCQLSYIIPQDSYWAIVPNANTPTISYVYLIDFGN